MFHPKFQAKSNNNNSYENIRVNCDGLSLIAVVAWTKLHFSYKVYTYDVFSTRDIGEAKNQPLYYSESQQPQQQYAKIHASNRLWFITKLCLTPF